MKCPSCAFENADQQKFCGECGARLPLSGSVTRRLVAPSYTPAHLADRILKSRSALEGERRQVTVLFCDIANSTATASRIGAERMHSLLDQFFQVVSEHIHRYEGTINQFLGDGVMALFGAPLMHEDHARRGVPAALDICSAMRARQLGAAGAASGITLIASWSIAQVCHEGCAAHCRMS